MRVINFCRTQIFFCSVQNKNAHNASKRTGTHATVSAGRWRGVICVWIECVRRGAVCPTTLPCRLQFPYIALESPHPTGVAVAFSRSRKAKAKAYVHKSSGDGQEHYCSRSLRLGFFFIIQKRRVKSIDHIIYISPLWRTSRFYFFSFFFFNINISTEQFCFYQFCFLFCCLKKPGTWMFWISNWVHRYVFNK